MFLAKKNIFFHNSYLIFVTLYLSISFFFSKFDTFEKSLQNVHNLF